MEFKTSIVVQIPPASNILSWSALKLCLRHNSACELCPVSASITTSALNCGVNLLRFAIGKLLSIRLQLYHNLGLAGGPNFRWQYRCSGGAVERKERDNGNQKMDRFNAEPLVSTSGENCLLAA